jgi:hypothetical protein
MWKSWEAMNDKNMGRTRCDKCLNCDGEYAQKQRYISTINFRNYYFKTANEEYIYTRARARARAHCMPVF